MPFQISPGIAISEIDLTAIVPSVSTTEGAFAGVFAWGPVNQPVLITSEIDLVKRYGTPISDFNTETFFVAADFLSYGNALYVSRASSGNTAANTALISANTIFKLNAKYPGALGNTLKVIITGKSAYATASSGIGSFTQKEPLTTNNVHVAIVDTVGTFGGKAGTVLEVFENLSILPTAKTEDGTNNFLVDALNTRSNFISIDETTVLVNNFGLFANTDISYTLTLGTNGNSEANTSANTLISAFDVFKSSDNIDISLILAGKTAGTDGVQVANYIIDNICEARKDCVVFISPTKTSVVNNVGNETTAVSTFSQLVSASSYAVVDSGYKYRYDKYNDKYVWTPLNGDIAGLCVRTDDVRDPWYSPAGYNRGFIKNVIKLAWNPNKTQRDQLYKVDVNPVITQPGQGTLLFGDKTHLGRASAFDRINVRRLFIILEKAISRAARTTLFEFNDTFTRAQFKNLVEPFLRNVQGRRGITDFRVVCDATNNTPFVIDANQFVGDIYVRPNRSINFIQLNFVSVRSGVEFEEIVGKF